MPDITMCADDTCPSAKSCYRHEATPSEYRQAYWSEPAKIRDGQDKCKYYWPFNNNEEKEKLDREWYE